MAGDYYPTTDGDKVTFLNNFLAALAGVSGPLGVTPPEIMALTTEVDNFRTALAGKTAKKTAAQAGTAVFRATDQTTEAAIRAAVRRIKAHAAYTQAIGEQLGIEAGGAPISGVPDRPDLRAASVLNGEVEIGFVKHGHSSVEIRSKRGAETAFSFLARDTESPYLDTRANLSAAPEKREYVAQFLDKDTLIGQVSDVLVVTVPGA